MVTFSNTYSFDSLRAKVFCYHPTYRNFESIDEAQVQLLKDRINTFLQ